MKPDDQVLRATSLIEGRIAMSEKTASTHPDVLTREIAKARVQSYRLALMDIETAFGSPQVEKTSSKKAPAEAKSDEAIAYESLRLLNVLMRSSPMGGLTHEEENNFAIRLEQIWHCMRQVDHAEADQSLGMALTSASARAERRHDAPPTARTDLADVRALVMGVLDQTVGPTNASGILQVLRSGRFDLTAFRDDMRAVLDEQAALTRWAEEPKDTRHALRSGRCMGCNDPSRPAELWFSGLSLGDTPTNSMVAAIADGWIEEWIVDWTGNR